MNRKTPSSSSASLPTVAAVDQDIAPQSPPPSPAPRGTRAVMNAGPTRADAAALLVLILLALYSETHGRPRERPALLTDPTLQFKRQPDIVPTRALMLGSFGLPPLFYALSYALPAPRAPRMRAVTAFALGLFETNLVTLLLVNSLKLYIGRPRPFFAAACVSYDPPGSTHCTGDAQHVMDARKSFPSGHSALSFSAASFTALALAASLRLSDPRADAKTLRLLAVWTPLVLAAFVAASRLVDFHHHFADVVAGSLLGAASGALAFRARGQALERVGGQATAPLALAYSAVQGPDDEDDAAAAAV